MEKEDVNLTVAKLQVAIGLVTASDGKTWEGARGEAAEAAAKYLTAALTEGEAWQ